MSEKDLNTLFNEAFEKASNMEHDSLPPDVMLRLYAYYKQATFGSIGSINYSNLDVRDAFKNNAWMQIRHISEDEAKRCYIAIINEVLNQEK
jgi:diazepam-binding inhibitor (GABA receptor modulator, acyl-CoA-binding protein)